MQQSKYYTTQLQAGLGMIQETLDLLRLWEPGIKPSSLAEQVIKTGLFSRTTARRARNLVIEMFAPRYLTNQGTPAKNLKNLSEKKANNDTLIQIFFLYTARSQKVFGDFVCDVYWPKYTAGATALQKSDALRFIHQSLDAGKMQKRWSESTIKKVSGYLLGCCLDFGLLAAGSGKYSIQRFFIKREVALYLAYELHFSSISDNGIVNHPDWRLFGLEAPDVIQLLKSLSHDGHILIQSSADLVQISWTYKSIEELLNVLIKR